MHNPFPNSPHAVGQDDQSQLWKVIREDGEAQQRHRSEDCELPLFNRWLGIR